MLMTVFILVLIQGLVSSDDQSEVQSCFSIVQSHDRGDRNDTLPDSEELLVLCPIVKEYFDCTIRNPNLYTLEQIPQLLAIRSFLSDLCNENSDTFKAYSDNLDCFRSIKNELNDCKEIGYGVIDEYVQSGYAFQIYHILNEEQKKTKSYYFDAEEFCLLHAYPFLCIGKKMQETCDSGAYDTYIDFTKRMRLTDNLCSNDVILKYFKKGYIEFLSNGNKTSEIRIFNDILGVKYY